MATYGDIKNSITLGASQSARRNSTDTDFEAFISASTTTPTFNTSITAPIIYGSSTADGDITIEGTSNATKTTSYVILQPTSSNVGIGVTAPTSKLHLAAGSATAGTAPLGFISGPLLTVSVVGKIEFLTDDYFATITTGAARKAFILDDGTRLTSGKIPVATTNGRLVNVTPQTELTDELTSITFTAPGAPDYAIQDLTAISGFGFTTKDEGNTVLSVIANLQTRVNELETKLVALGLLVDAD